MLKNLLRELIEFFEIPENENSDNKQLSSEYNYLVSKVKERIYKFKGIRGLALFSSSGSLLFKEVLEREGLNLENFASLVINVHKLADEYSVDSALSCILLGNLNFFMKGLKINGKNYYLVIISDKSQPLGALISFLGRLEVDDVDNK